MTKGTNSFWYPYFRIAQESDLPCFWDEADIDALEDALLKQEIIEYKEDYDCEYEALREVALLYP